MTSDTVTHSQGKRWTGGWILFVALWLTLMLLAIKLWSSWATQSLSLAAAALHTLIAGFSLLLSLFAVSTAPHPSREWGHRRLESTLLLLLVGLVGFVTAILLALIAQRLGLLTLVDWEVMPVGLPLLQLLGIVTVIQFGSSIAARAYARSQENTMLKFSFNQSLFDAGLMTLILSGSFSPASAMSWVDGVLTGIASLLAILNLGRIANRQLASLMQHVAIAPEAVAKTVRRVEGILHCYNIQTRGLVGRFVYIEMHLILHPECVSVAPAIVQRVERLIAQQYGLAKVVVHIDDKTA